MKLRLPIRFVLIFCFQLVSVFAFAQTVGGTAAADDFDGDGIINSIDLDDDNDGIPDSDEYCKSSILLPATNTTAAITEFRVPTGWTITNSSPDIATTASSIYSGWVGGCSGTAPAAPNGHTSWVNFYSNTQEAFKTTISGLTVGKTYILKAYYAKFASTPALGRITVKLGTTVIDQYTPTLGCGWETRFITFTATATSHDLQFQNTGIVSPMQNASVSISADPLYEVCDTDNDGLPNQFDLDSDGDGCTDAKEGNVPGTLRNGDVKNGANGGVVTSTTNMPGAISGGVGTYGANGLANEVETSAESGIINYISSYTSYALSANLNTCTGIDSDGDGVSDLTDLDDDNDGILDLTEGYGCATLTNDRQIFNDPVIKQFNLVVNGDFEQGDTGFNTTYVNVGSIGTCGSYIVAPFGWASSVGSLSEGNALQINADCSAPFTEFWSQSINVKPNTNYKLGFSIKHGNPATVSYSINGGALTGNFATTANWVSKQSIINSGSNTSLLIKLFETSGAPNSADFIADDIFLIEVKDVYCSGSMDTDNDGIFNHLDLDSDGDGCPDAKEAGVFGTLNSGAVKNGFNGAVSSTTTLNDAVAAGPYGSNGLANGVETSAESGSIRYFSKYTPFALAKNLSVCSDFDNDGIADPQDIDDDNDGTLDAVESPSCFYSSRDWLVGLRSDIQVSTDLVMSNSYQSPKELVDGDNGTTTASWAVSFVASTTPAKTVYAFKMPMAVELKTIYLGYINANTHFNANTVLRLEGSNDNSSWTILGNGYAAVTSVPGVVGVANANSFTVTQNTGKYLFYRIYWVSGGGVGTTGYTNEVYFETLDTYIPSVNPKINCSGDTDGDGFFNFQDLDSDADGCSDALEAGATTNHTANFQFSFVSPTNDANNNGLIDTIEGVTAGTLNYSSNYNTYALTASINACLDSDQDGVNDVVDLDDDNDGILDRVECDLRPGKILFAGSNEDYATMRSSLFAEFDNNKAPGATIVQSNIIETSTVPAGFYDGYDMVIFGGAAFNTIHANHWAALQTAIQNKTSKAFIIESDNCCVVANQNGLMNVLNNVFGTRYELSASHPGINQTYTLNSNNSYASVFTTNSIDGNNYFPIINVDPADILFYSPSVSGSALAGMKQIPGSSSKNQFLAWFVDGTITQGAPWYTTNENKIAPAFYNAFSSYNNQNCDTDEDGVPNRLDLDSDGDGCADALESGITSSVLTSGTAVNLAGSTILSGTLTSTLSNAVVATVGSSAITFGNNGFANSLETSSESGVYNSTYNYPFAISKNYAACADFDQDGITDVKDIDDDNDGVLDAVESPNCFFTASEWLSGARTDVQVSTGLAMSATYKSPSKLVDGDNATGGGSYAVNFVASTSSAKTVYAFKMPVPVELKTVYVGYINSNTHFNTGTSIELQGSNDNSSWTNLGTGYAAVTSVPSVTGTINANTFSVTQNSAKYLYYRIYWASGGGINASGYSNEVYFETLSNYQSSANPKSVCINDTDTDGILNHQDLDSDGDVCSDASEAGATTNTTANFQFVTLSNDANNNGISDLVEGATAGTINYALKYAVYAVDGAVNACIDSDGDGVNDVFDIDDDNDGILDGQELNCNLSLLSKAGITLSSTVGWTYNGAVTLANLVDDSEAVIAYSNANSSGEFLNQTVLQFNLPSSKSLSLIELSAQANTSPLGSGKYSIQGWDGYAWIDIITNQTFATSVPKSGSTNSYKFNLSNNYNAYSKYRIYGTTNKGTVSGWIQEAYFTERSCLDADTDGDGVSNRLDLDSDGDGCSDAIESNVPKAILTLGTAVNLIGATISSGTTSSTLQNAVVAISGTSSSTFGLNGFVDAVETATESGLFSGTYTYANAKRKDINACLDTDGDSIYDLVDIDDDNDGVLDNQECAPFDINKLSYAARSFTVSNGASAQQTFPAAPDGLVVNIWSLDNSFNIRINGSNIVGPQELEFYSPSYSNAVVEFLDGTTYGAVWDIAGSKSSPLARIYIDKYGLVKLYGKRTSGGILEEMRLRNGFFNTVNLNTNANNTFQIGQIVIGQTFVSGDYGVVIGANCDFDGDGISNGLDLDSDGDGCPDAKEAGVTGTLIEGTIQNLVGNTLTSTNNIASAVISGTFGANGFANNLETTNESGLANYASTYFSYANNATINICTDTDNDGVADILDIDDDNDGILDAIESPACFNTITEAGIVNVLSTDLEIYNNNVITRASDNDLTSYSAFNPSINWVGKELFRIKPNIIGNIAISGLKLELFNWALSNGSGNTFKLQGSIDNGVTWADLSSAVSSTSTTGSFTIQNTINPSVKYGLFRIVGVAGTSYYGGVYEISLVLPNSYQASAYQKTSCTVDTDNDGISNHLDLDSDGDGCPDANESSIIGVLTSGDIVNKVGNVLTTTNNVPSSISSGTYGGNGFADALETSTESGIYSSVYTYYYANNALFNMCKDADGDGSKDIVDIDDDNDGVLDAIESPDCFTSTSDAAIPLALTSELDIYSGNIPSRANDNNLTTYSAFNPNINWVGKELFRIIPNVVGPIAISGIRLDLYNWAISNGGANTFKLQGSKDNGASWSDLSTAVSSTATSGLFTISNTLNPNVKYSIFRIVGVAGSSYYGGVNELNIVLPNTYSASSYPKPNCTSDFDGDGILNHLDLDSDGDGCPDAKEATVKGTLTTGDLVNLVNYNAGAGSATSTTSTVSNSIAAGSYGANGFADALETSAESGIYSYTYVYKIATNRLLNGCLDTDNDGLGDVVDIDDDNDGILDTSEQTNCITSGIDLTTLTYSGSAITAKTASTFTTAGGDVWKSSYADQNLKLPISLKFKHNSTTGYEMFGLLPVAAAQTSANWNDGAYKFYPQGTNTYGYFTSAWDFGPVAITTNDVLSIDISVTGYVTAAINGVTQKAFQGTVSDYKLAISSYRASSVSDIILTDATRPANFSCSDLDTDADGIPNRIDLDSDGDGCPDAKESGIIGTLTSGSITNKVNGNNVTTNNVANAIAAGVYGDNGFANSIETSTESGLYTGTYTYYFATDALVSACLDTDSDGVTDMLDLDDDNDGVLDTVECPLTNIIVNGEFTGNTSGWTANANWVYNTSGFVWNSADNVSNNLISQTFTKPIFNAESSNVDIVFDVNTNGTGWAITSSGTATLDVILNNTTYATITNPNGGTTASVVAKNGAIVNVSSINIVTTNVPSTKIIVSVPRTVFTNSNTIGFNFGATVDDIGIDNVFIGTQVSTCDTDGDGRVNSKDLDSDGDGCFDAVEAGTTYISTSGVASYAKLTTNIIPGNYGTNGFADGLETSTDSGIYTGTYSYGYAIDANGKACLDTDNDGVADIYDLDDDNDGVLDTVECPLTNILVNGTFTGNNTGWTANANWVWKTGDFVWNSADNVTNNVISQTFAKPIFEAEASTEDISFDFNTNGIGWAITSAGTATMDVSINNVVYATLTNPSGGTTASVVAKNGATVNVSTVNIVTDNVPNTKIIIKVPKSIFTNSNTIAFSFSATTDDIGIDNVFVGTKINTCDTDNDGVINSKDLDSDGDGCSDASEAKTVSSLTATTVSGSYGNNGFANSIETATESGLYSGTYFYSRAIDPNIKGCLDSDYDGVADIDDLDDDNDGILDSNECSVALMIENNAANLGQVSRKSWMLTGYDEAAVNTYAGTFFGNVRAEATQTLYGAIKLPPTAATTINEPITSLDIPSLNLGTVVYREVYVKIPATTAFSTASQINFRIANSTIWSTGMLYMSHLGAVITTPIQGGGGSNSLLLSTNSTDMKLVSQAKSGSVQAYQGGSFVVSSANAGKWVRIGVAMHDGINNEQSTVQYTLGSSTTWLPVDVVNGFQFAATNYDNSLDEQKLVCDTDGDGIPNQLDLDSDGDGCSDANEAYGLTTAQGTDGNQYYGNSPITVDATGKIIGASYTATSSNVINVGSGSTITTQPTDQSINIGGTAVFATTITAGTGITTYQWQVSADGGTTWNNVTNSSIYTGAGTLTLTVSNVPLTMKGYRYRLNITQSNYVCGNVTSSVARLLMDNTPIVVDDNATGTEDTPINGNVLSNDKGSGNPAAGITVSNFTIGGVTYTAGQTATIAGVGTIIINANGTYTFTPTANYNGSLPAIDYTATDANGGTDIGTLNLIVNAVNDAPIAVDDVKSVNENTQTTGNVLTDGTDDADVDGNILTVTQFKIGSTTYNVGTTATIPGVGTIVVNANGTYTFAPATGYTGSVPNIDYTISDGNGGSDIGTLSITVNNVNDAPLATDDIQTVNQNTTATGNLLTNDADVDANATLTVTQYSFTIGGTTYTYTAGSGTVTMTGIGTININSNGAYTFVPTSSYTGTVPPITYTLSDGSLTDNALLDLFVQPVNAAPVAVDDAKSTVEDTPATGNVLTNDTDANNGDTKTVVGFTVGGQTYPAGSTAIIAGVGTIVINSDGSYTFTPFANYNGTVPTISYTVSDGNGGTDIGDLVISVSAMNDNPIAVNDDNKVTPEDTPVTVNVLTNDSDPDGATNLTVTQFSIGGVTYPIAQNVLIPGKGTLTAISNGDFTFTPLANFNGTLPTILYTVSDGVATNTANFNLTVTPVNDAPTVIGETITTSENTAVAGNVLTNDTDVETGTASNTISQFTIGGVTYTAGSIVDIPNVGTIIVNANGNYTFTPVLGYYGTVPSITYTVADPNGGIATGSLAITVTPVNDPPVVVSESVLIQEDAIATGNLLTNDTDPENNTLTITQFTIAGLSGTFTASTSANIPGVGTIIINANGTYTFTPTANYNGVAPAIAYTVSDGLGGTTNGNLTIVVAAVNDAPIVVNDTKSEPVNTPITGNVLTNDRDVEASTLTVANITIAGVTYPVGQLTTITGVGTILMNADGTYTFTPALNYVGSLPAITYLVSDGTATSSGTLSLTITPIDADGDGIPDAIEKGNGSTPLDTDNDGTPDYLDTDSDGDGIPDNAEDNVCIGFMPCTPTDTDGDGTPDYRDVDSDGDGILDATEDAVDIDADGIPNYRDTDSDGDGILDSIEKGPSSTPVDTDNDGTPNYLDLDSDGDGISDAIEKGSSSTPVDTDNDGTPNYLDLDSDGDGLPDSIEKGSGSTPMDTDGDGIPNYLDTDSDGDGILDSYEDNGCTGTAPCTPTDTDGDGTPDYLDLDSDNDGILDSLEKGSGTTPADTDGDGIPNFRDLDSDGDGIVDAIEKGTGATLLDTDGDGTPNFLDIDSDGDGIPDNIEKGSGSSPIDTDGDGVPDYLDIDSDNDGIPDSIEDAGCTGTAPCTPTDSNGDGIPNYKDLDSDGDGITDAIEKGSNGSLPVDTDSDGTPDYLDIDSDGDGISDAIEKGTGTTPIDKDGDGIPDYRDTDSDNDGISDLIEKGPTSTPVDTDGDGIPDYKDLDSDGDGKPDQSEGSIDTDGDGTPNFKDLDSDGDGVLDAVDQCPLVDGLGSASGCPPDSDGDGLIDASDADDDNDGILDTVEAAACSPTNVDCDTDADGIPNRLDIDSDGDGINDVIEAGGTDSNNDGIADGTTDINGVPSSANGGVTPPNTDGTGNTNPYDVDSDGDGISDAIEKGTGTTLADTDGDNIPDYLDLDSDGDGISDAIEKGTGSSVADTDNDGIPDFRDLDSDGDAIPDSVEKGSLTNPIDSDNDGIPNYRDIDSDGDGITDITEDIICTGSGTCSPTDTDTDGTPDYLDADSDGDGIPDTIEKGTGSNPVDTDGDGTPDYLDTDSDGDGISDNIEDAGCTGTAPCTPTDTDGDGIPNFRDLDSDGDGISDNIEKGATSTPDNSDSDSIPDYLDSDSDGDGISDAIEKGSGTTPADTDNDGTPDYLDLDSDGDGIPDNIEKGTSTLPVDTDSDGTPDFLDTDTDGDGIPDSVEDAACTGSTCTPTDSDGDGIPNHKDLDSDGDGIPDSIEKGSNGSTPVDTDGTGLPDYLDTDSDGDGIPDSIEKGIDGNNPLDTDGDGIPDYKDIDSDNDGIPDSIEKGTGATPLDTDGDGIPDYRDTDSDGDGILDNTEDAGCSGTAPCTPTDTDNDGIPNYRDLDSDGDNKTDLSEGETDYDADGIPNYLDPDSDGDGINDNVDQCPLLPGIVGNNGCPVDTDGDGVYDINDSDDDNDGILDTVEAAACSPSAPDCDTDGDGIPNRLDPDSDNDGIPDVIESNGIDVDGDGKVDGGADANGVPTSSYGGAIPPNTDGTTLTNPYDTDSDGDGISDLIEKGANGNSPIDSDGDGIPDYRDTDSDNDGIPDSIERGTNTSILDTDGDGIPDYRDTDSDGDGILDSIEGTVDTDGDGIPNYRDIDSDGDGIKDSIEKGTGSTLLDTDGDGIPNYIDLDSDGDGISDAIEKGLDPNNPIDTDGDGKPDYLDTDSDNDGIPDAVEKGTTNTPADTDGDGVPNYRDLDSDGDGILDSIEDDGCSGTSPCTPTDTDGDGIPNYLDVDTDGDGKLDSVEKGPGATPMDSDRDGIPDYRDVDNLGNADVNVTNINTAVTGNLKTNDEVPVGTTYKQPAANANNPAGAILVVNADGTYSFNATTPGKYIYFVPVCGPNQTNGCPLSPLEITVLDPINIDKPVTNNDFAIILQGTPINLNVLANDQAGDPSKIIDPSSLTIVTNPLHGTVIVNNNGSITYTPNAYFVGTDSLVYQVCDNNSPTQCQTAITYFKIEATGSTPVTTASDDYISTVASATTANTVSGTVLLNDQNSGGGILTASLISGPSSAQGTLVFNSDGTYSFTPSAGFVGPINIVYEVCGGSPVDCAKATLHILVNPAPTLTNDAATAYVNIPTSGNISTNDVVPTGTTYSQPAALTGATIVVNANGTYSFTATTSGTYTYTVPVCAPGQTNNCPTETLVIVVPINTLVDDNATVEINTDLAGNISSNDLIPVGTTYGQPAQLTGATISVNANGTYTFTAISAGTYTYTIPVCAPGQTTNCPTESLVITVTSPAPPLPVPPTPPITSIVNPDFGVTNKSVPLTGNLSTNDVVSSGTTYGQPAANPANPAGGVITVSPNGTYTFTATVPGKYTYYVPTCAPGQTTGCPLTPLDITVVDPSIINNPPAINNDFAKTTVNTPVVISVLANDKATNKGGVISIGTAIVKVDPVHCTAIFNADGTLTYTPAPNFVGTDSLTYQICDNSNPANCQTALVYITVAASTVSPTTIPNDDFINSLYGASSAGNVLLNDINTGTLNTSNALTASLVAGPAAAQGSFTMNADGTYTFTPTAGFSGPLDIVYKVCGGTPNTCANATLHILVAPQDPPVISPDFGVVNKSVPLTGNLNTNDQVAIGTTYGQPASNSLNPSGASIVINPNGSYTFNATNPGTYTYYVPTCAPAQTTGCPLSPLVITVTDPLISNNPPIANLDLVVTKSNTPVTTDVLANDKAGNSGSVLNISSLSISSQPKHGTVVVNPNGTLSYTPTSGFVGTDSLVYSICDNTSPTAICKTAIVYYTVNASNSAPATIASDDFVKAIAGSQISGNVLNNDNNTAGATLAVTSNTSVPASKGVFTMNPNGSYSFTPAPGFTGPIDIIYTVCGGTPSICTNATLHLLIEPMIIPTILDVTKVAGSVIMNLDASFDVSFTIKVKNLSSQFIDSVLLKDDLSKVFTDTRGVKVVSVTTSGGLVRNANYDGISNIDLLSISSVLDPNKVDSVILRVNVSNNTSGIFQNTAIASTPTIYGISISVSTDPTTDTNLSDSTKKPTVFIIPKVDLIVPEGFSPNNDGIDDTWIIQKPFGSKVEVRVFNRWGNEVFSSTDYKNDWRGKATSNFLGEDLSEGTYYYIVIGTDISGKQLKLAGNLTIKR